MKISIIKHKYVSKKNLQKDLFLIRVKWTLSIFFFKIYISTKQIIISPKYNVISIDKSILCSSIHF